MVAVLARRWIVRIILGLAAIIVAGVIVLFIIAMATGYLTYWIGEVLP